LAEGASLRLRLQHHADAPRTRRCALSTLASTATSTTSCRTVRSHRRRIHRSAGINRPALLMACKSQAVVAKEGASQSETVTGPSTGSRTTSANADDGFRRQATPPKTSRRSARTPRPVWQAPNREKFEAVIKAIRDMLTNAASRCTGGHDLGSRTRS
jgi:hypothetical protein